MVLIVCSSVFQLYVAIIIKCCFLKDKTVDLFLTDSTPMFKRLWKNEKLLALFHTVRYCDIGQNWQELTRIEKSHYFRPFFELFPEYYVKRVWKTNLPKYDSFYFSVQHPNNIMLQTYIMRKNRGATIHRFEDGISTYLLDFAYKYTTPKFLRNIFRVVDIEKSLQDIYVFEPDLFCIASEKNLIKIPRVIEHPELISIFNSIFDNADFEISETFLFFEESFNNDGYVTNDKELIEELWNLCGKTDFIIKHHPRNRSDRFKEILPSLTVSILWEHYFLNHSIDDKVIVTVSSNTAFVPKIIADCEPTVILLYKLFKGSSPLFQSGNFEKYVDRYLKKFDVYSKHKIYIPETIDEYRNIVEMLQKNNKEKQQHANNCSSTCKTK